MADVKSVTVSRDFMEQQNILCRYREDQCAGFQTDEPVGVRLTQVGFSVVSKNVEVGNGIESYPVEDFKVKLGLWASYDSLGQCSVTFRDQRIGDGQNDSAAVRLLLNSAETFCSVTPLSPSQKKYLEARAMAILQNLVSESQ